MAALTEVPTTSPDSMAIAGKWETFVTDEPDKRSALSIGMEWSSRITTIGLEFALPAFLGFGLDRWWKTSPWMTVGGVVSRAWRSGMIHVFRLASQLPGGSGRRNGRGQAGPHEERRRPGMIGLTVFDRENWLRSCSCSNSTFCEM